MVSVGEVYTFKHLWIGESDSKESGRILDTTLHLIQTVKTQVENLSEEQRCTFNDIALLEPDGENHQYMELNIDNIDPIEERLDFKQCPKWQKKFSTIIQVLSQNVIIVVVLSEAPLWNCDFS